MLSFVGYTLMEMRFFLETWYPGEFAAFLEALFVMAVVGAWLWALSAGAGGGRGGRKTRLVLSGLTLVIALFDLQYVFPGPMEWPLAVMIFVMLFASLGALLGMALVRPGT